jgi:glucose-6-phosphate 1-dehydrogenase
MTSNAARLTPGDPCAFVVFGAMGDLTKRKLLPALYNLQGNGLLPGKFAFIGVARRPLDDGAYREYAAAAARELATGPAGRAPQPDFTQRVHYVKGDFEDPATYAALAAALAHAAREHGAAGNVIFYLATPPSEFAVIVRGLAGAGLTREDGGWRRVVIEKPFGHDLESARALNRELTSLLSESQIFRIDHYLGKETVQNLLVFRLANGIFEPIWNRRYVDHLQITVAEELGMEGRGAYYEQAGAIRDLVQNHMLQLLSLVAMEPPSTLSPEAVRNEKVKVLEAIRTMEPEQVLRDAVRGQYGAGQIEGTGVPAYRAEPGVSPNSRTETYAALKLMVENWRWAGVPFYLRSGKRLAQRDTQISIQFRRPPLLLFEEAGVDQIEPNRLDILIQPEEAISISMKAKRPGPTIVLEPVKLHFSYAGFGPQPPATGYERLLHDAILGDPELFHRADLVEASWRIVMPVLDVWSTLPAREFPNYAAGSWGPAAATELLARDGRRWVNPG